MIVYRICQTYPPDHNPIDGEGSFLYGGRWNSIGVHAVYTAESLALARAEMARHINLESIPDGFSVYEIEIPDEYVDEVNNLPEEWNVDPPSWKTQEIGDGILADHQKLGFKIPSICDPYAVNIVLNPKSKSFHKVKVIRHYPFHP